ncbi:MAG: DUF4124 domain-containing protein [Burkholderiales bacterium]|nr:DUF4124 domain-containing protein [Burkholderiales bacterium]
MIVRVLILICVAFASAAAVAADTYRWEDEGGGVHYSDHLPPPGARNIRRTRLYIWELEQVLPYTLQLAVERAPVTLYVTDCGEPCRMAREFLLDRGVPHTLLDASKADVQKALMKLTEGVLEVPVAEVGKTVLRGFEEGQWNVALDAVGYPRFAMIDVKPVEPQATEQAVDDQTGDAAPSETDQVDPVAVKPNVEGSEQSAVDDVDTNDLENESADVVQGE